LGNQINSQPSSSYNKAVIQARALENLRQDASTHHNEQAFSYFGIWQSTSDYVTETVVSSKRKCAFFFLYCLASWCDVSVLREHVVSNVKAKNEKRGVLKPEKLPYHGRYAEKIKHQTLLTKVLAVLFILLSLIACCGFPGAITRYLPRTNHPTHPTPKLPDHFKLRHPSRITTRSCPPKYRTMSLSKIKTFYDNYPNISQYFGNSAAPTATLEEDVKKLDVTDDKVESFRREFLYIGGPEVIERSRQKKEVNKPLYKHNAGSPS
jgi:hypothetical protein